MKRLLRLFIHTLVVSIFLSGFPVGSTFAETSNSPTSNQQKKSQKKRKPKTKKKSSKKKPRKKKSAQKRKKPSKKKPTKKRKTRKKPTSKKKPTRKKRRPAKKKVAKKPTKRKVKRAAPKPVEAEKPKPERVSIYELSDKIYQLTYDLDASVRRLEKAKLSLKPLDRPSMRKPSVDKIRLIEEKARKDPNDLFTQRELALEYEQKGMFARAKDIYLRMIAANPSNPDYHYYLGSLYSRNGQHHKAKFAYEEALEIDPNHAATIAALSTYSKSPEDQKMATALYQKAAEKEPEGPAYLINKIHENLNAGSYNDVITLGEEGRTKYPNNYIFPFLLGQAYEAKGNIENAKKLFKLSMEMDKTDVSAAIALANLYYNQGNYLYAAITYENVLSVKPMDIDIRFKHGMSYFKTYEWTKAASAWEDLLHYAPNHPQVRHLLPQVYYVLSLEYNRNGYTDLGRRAFANALSINSQSNDWLGDALKIAGEYYREHGLYRQALNAYQDAIEINPSDAENYTGLGSTYWSMGESEMAVAAWEKSLSIQPTNNDAKGWLIIAKRHTG